MDVRKRVRKAERDPWNRLNSILEDADWVASFCAAQTGKLPVIPNLRCGAWYVPPNSTQKGCYFKSTDGHTSQWDFSLKRYNLDLINTIQREGGCVIVDSTRRGKSMPDALSKTIPIWCAVLNGASYKRHQQPSPTSITLSNDVVSPSEQEQIISRMDSWIEALLSSELLVPRLDKPLQPIFVTRGHRQSGLLDKLKEGSEQDFYPVVLISASQMVPTPGLDPLPSPVQKSWLRLPKEVEMLRQKVLYIYVQGSGDDEEMWSFHLDPSTFWEPTNLLRILRVGEGGEKIESTLKQLVEDNRNRCTIVEAGKDVKLGDLNIMFGQRSPDHVFNIEEREKYALIVQADAASSHSKFGTDDREEENACRIILLHIASGKRGLAAFRKSLQSVISAARVALPKPILLCSREKRLGGDLVGGLAVAILSSCYDDDRSLIESPQNLSKDDVRRRLQWMATMLPNLTPPSRGHLLKINEVLLSGAYRSDNQEDSSKLAESMAAMSTA